MDLIPELLWVAKYQWGHPHILAIFPWDQALTRAWEVRVQAWDPGQVRDTQAWEAPAPFIQA